MILPSFKKNNIGLGSFSLGKTSSTLLIALYKNRSRGVLNDSYEEEKMENAFNGIET